MKTRGDWKDGGEVSKGCQRLEYLDSSSASLMDNVSPTQLIGAAEDVTRPLSVRR